MNMFFDWWFATSLRLRQFCWAVWLLVLVTLIFLSLTHHEESDALIRLRANHHQQWAARGLNAGCWQALHCAF